ncbi:MAG: hypothetical protein H0W77_16385 [Acidobacteria bacterium]|nr:hypothetical protein [Acidobacteriota bacterium]
MKHIIKNIEKLANAWKTDEIPSFHDAEIISILLNRKNGVSIEIKIRIYKFLENFEIEGKKFNRLLNANSTLKFLRTELKQLEYFNHQNVIADLHISPIENSDSYLVHFESSHGCELRFECEEIELTEIEIFETEKEAYQPDSERIRKFIEFRKSMSAESISEKNS